MHTQRMQTILLITLDFTFRMVANNNPHRKKAMPVAIKLSGHMVVVHDKTSMETIPATSIHVFIFMKDRTPLD